MKFKFVIICIIIFISIFLFFWKFNDEHTDINQKYQKCVGKIIDKKIESKDEIQKIKNSNKFTHIKKFRIKITYIYNVNNKDYYGNFYNDRNDKFLDAKEYAKIGKMYNYVKFINLYYNKDKPYDSCINLNEIQNRKKKIFYILSIGLLFTIPFILFS